MSPISYKGVETSRLKRRFVLFMTNLTKNEIF